MKKFLIAVSFGLWAAALSVLPAPADAQAIIRSTQANGNWSTCSGTNASFGCYSACGLSYCNEKPMHIQSAGLSCGTGGCVQDHRPDWRGTQPPAGRKIDVWAAAYCCCNSNYGWNDCGC